MIKVIYLAALAALAVACGAPADDGVELGTLAEGISVPELYGLEADGTACSPPWAGGECFAPDDKSYTVRFVDGTCSTWWADRANEAWANLVPQINALAEWELTGVSGNAHYYWQCTTSTALGFGAFDPTTGNGSTDDHDVTGWGTFRQYHLGNVYVAPSVIEAQPSWQAATDTQRRRWARNYWRFLLAQQVGHGRTSSGLMAGPSDAWFSSERGFSAAMYDRMECYSEDSGTGPDC